MTDLTATLETALSSPLAHLRDVGTSADDLRRELEALR